MSELFLPVLRDWGQEVTLISGGVEKACLALVQPIPQREGQERGGVLGRVDERLWLYLGQGPLAEGDSVLWQGRRFRVEAAAELRVGQRLSHWQATLRPERECAT